MRSYFIIFLVSLVSIENIKYKSVAGKPAFFFFCYEETKFTSEIASFLARVCAALLVEMYLSL